MSPKQSITELKRMTPSELRMELKVKRAEVAKLRLGLTLQKEKNSAAYRLLKGDVARICQVLADMQKAGVPEKGVAAAKAESTEKPSQTAKKSVKRSSSKSPKK